MSADNQILIRVNDSGEYCAQMIFMSDDHIPHINRTPRGLRFETLAEAVQYADTEYAEYGVRIDISNLPNAVTKRMMAQHRELLEPRKVKKSMEIQKFVRRPFAVRGVQVTEENMEEVASWCGGKIQYDPLDAPIYIEVNVKHALNDRQRQAYVGDYVLSTKKGFKVYLERAFHTNFKAFDEVAEGVKTNIVQFNITNEPIHPDRDEYKRAYLAKAGLA